MRQNFAHFFVGRLRKVFIPLADSAEVFRHDHGHDLVGCSFHLVIGRRRDGRRSDDDAPGVQLSKRRDGGQHRRARGDAVIDEDHGFPLDVGRREIVAISPLAAHEFALLVRSDRVDDVVRDAQRFETSRLSTRTPPVAIAPIASSS